MKILSKVKIKNEFLDKNHPIVFIHTPKTAGTNLNCMTRTIAKINGYNSLSKNSIKSFFNTKLFYVAFFPESIGFLAKIYNDSQNFNLTKNNVKFFYEHMPLPENDYLFGSLVNYITLVREPFSRAISLMNFLTQENNFTIIEAKDYVLDHETDNLQTRMLAGEKYMSGECNNSTYKQAIYNVDNKFSVVAPTEDVEIVMSILAKHSQVENWAIEKARTTKKKIINGEEFRQHIASKNFYDEQLYKYVKTKWDNWKSLNIEIYQEELSVRNNYLVLKDECYKSNGVEYMNATQLNEYNSQTIGNEGICSSEL